VQVGGVLDMATTPDVRRSLQHAVDDGARTVVLDLTGVRLIDSTALGTIVWLHKQLQERGGHVCVAAPQPLVLKVLELTSVDRLIRIYDSVEAAEDDLSTGGER
jgi:anti-anti-sigma factor